MVIWFQRLLAVLGTNKSQSSSTLFNRNMVNMFYYRCVHVCVCLFAFVCESVSQCVSVYVGGGGGGGGRDRRGCTYKYVRGVSYLKMQYQFSKIILIHGTI